MQCETYIFSKKYKNLTLQVATIEANKNKTQWHVETQCFDFMLKRNNIK